MQIILIIIEVILQRIKTNHNVKQNRSGADIGSQKEMILE